MIARLISAGFLTLGLLAPQAAPAVAEQYPVKPVRLIVPFPPGGSNDVMARIVGENLSKKIGQTVLVENRPGAGGIVGLDYVAKAEPDGYTLLMGAFTTLVGVPSYKKSLPFDVLKDFTTVTPIARGPFVLAVPGDLPVNTTAEFLELAKSQPGKLNYGSAGLGSSGHLVSELFLASASIKINHITYKGFGEAITDLLAGRIQFLLSDMSPLKAYIDSGRLKALGVSTEEVFELYPHLTPLTKSGAPGFTGENWYGLVGPAGMPDDVVSKLNEAVLSFASDADIMERFHSLGLNYWQGTPEDLRLHIDAEISKWTAVVKRAEAQDGR